MHMCKNSVVNLDWAQGHHHSFIHTPLGTSDFSCLSVGCKAAATSKAANSGQHSPFNQTEDMWHCA